MIPRPSPKTSQDKSTFKSQGATRQKHSPRLRTMHERHNSLGIWRLSSRKWNSRRKMQRQLRNAREADCLLCFRLMKNQPRHPCQEHVRTSSLCADPGRSSPCLGSGCQSHCQVCRRWLSQASRHCPLRRHRHHPWLSRASISQ